MTTLFKEKPVVYVVTRISGIVTAVRQRLPDVEIKDIQLAITESLTEVELEDIRQNAEVMFANPYIIGDVIYTCRKLKWAQTTTAGIDFMMKKMDPLKPFPEVVVTRSCSGYGTQMAEYVIAYILSIERNLVQMLEEQRQGKWNPLKFGEFRSLSDLRLGILGVGEIGMEIGRKCKALGMEVWGLTRTSKTIGPGELRLDAYKTIDQLPDLLESCDYICCVLPSTPNTTDLLSGGILSHCKNRQSVLINVGRGNVINEESIITALTNGWIRHAVLDVFRTEPLPKESKLRSFPNVYITPHISGPSRTDPLADSFVQNYTRFVNGETLKNVVKWDEGY